MICISIAQESRRFALVDMLNAAKQCDLIELRLDRFEKNADIKELLSHKTRPVIMSCRRPKDGGEWDGSEEERLALLRQCIVAKADYVEIEHDVAGQIRPFPPAKRVISYTNLQETPSNLMEIYQECCAKNADVVKLTTLARTPEEAWPLVQVLGKATLPTVVVGLGKPGIMLTILGKKLAAPWTYAALERGMETYPGQPTVHDLNHVYHYPAVDKGTRFIGVTGFSELEYAIVGVLNGAFADLKLNARCLPLAIGDIPLFRKVIEATRLAGVVVDAEHRQAILEIANQQEKMVQQSQAADLLVRKQDQWEAYNTLSRAAVAALEGTLRARGAPPDKPLNGRMVMITGTNPNARTMAHAIQRRGGIPIIAGRDRTAAQEIAQAVGCRHIPWEAVYATVHDTLIVCSEEKAPPRKGQAGEGAGLFYGYLKPSITVMDLTSTGLRSHVISEAKARACPVVSPRDILLDQLELQLKLLSGQSLPRERLKELLEAIVGPEAEAE
jgi:3-dehydroquinate dehydratase/shikimate dehydrogenase